MIICGDAPPPPPPEGKRTNADGLISQSKLGITSRCYNNIWTVKESFSSFGLNSFSQIFLVVRK